MGRTTTQALSGVLGECMSYHFFFFFQAEDGIRDYKVTGVQTCALPILMWSSFTSTSPRSMTSSPFIVMMRALRTTYEPLGVARGTARAMAIGSDFGTLDRKSVV